MRIARLRSAAVRPANSHFWSSPAQSVVQSGAHRAALRAMLVASLVLAFGVATTRAGGKCPSRAPSGGDDSPAIQGLLDATRHCVRLTAGVFQLASPLVI